MRAVVACLAVTVVCGAGGGCDDDGGHDVPDAAAAADVSDAVPFLYGDGRYGFVHEDGRAFGDARFDTLGRFHEGLAVARQGDRWGVLRPDLRWQVPPRYARVDDYADGRAIAYDLDPPWLGPLMGLILKEGTLTTDVLDRRGVVVSRDVRRQNTVPDAPTAVWPLPDARFAVRAGAGGRVGVVDTAADDKSVLPQRFAEVRIVVDAHSGETRFLAAREDANGRFTVYDTAGAAVGAGFYDVFDWSSEGVFVAASGDNGWYGAYDERGVVVAGVAYEGFVFDHGLAEAHVADVGPVWVSKFGTIYADRSYIKARHALAGRAP